MDQQHPSKLLFVCSANRLRSPTAEKLFEHSQQYQARSRGVAKGARVRLTAADIGWADLIVCMDKEHSNRLLHKFRKKLAEKRMVTLFIPDEYEFMQPELVTEVRSKLGRYVVVPDDFPTSK
jgi:predicted protein tyrosine phosphatase